MAILLLTVNWSAASSRLPVRPSADIMHISTPLFVEETSAHVRKACFQALPLSTLLNAFCPVKAILSKYVVERPTSTSSLRTMEVQFARVLTAFPNLVCKFTPWKMMFFVAERFCCCAVVVSGEGTECILWQSHGFLYNLTFSGAFFFFSSRCKHD